jgi:hypothetical protein
MQEFEKLGSFYLGRPYDLATRQGKPGLTLYDSKDLVTHALCVGMTGSGKTGLCLSLLEEAAIDGIPALVIDPKGDLANLLLTFPDLRGDDFRPWINEEDASRKGISSDAFAAEQAELWRNGLAKWGQDGTRIQRLRDAADFAIYTPGSDAGIPLSMLRSFDAPGEAVRQDRELFRDRISATVTALLGLVAIEADPIQSREHILLATILGNAWQKGQNLELGDLIQQIQSPPMTRIGVLDLDSFFPSKDRFGLAMALNNLLASPGFSAWTEGEPLEVDALLRSSTGKPKISILSIAHLSDAERMFFVALVLNQTVSWMRQQSGTTSLRALIYMDEIFGYFPPVANPPSKLPLLTLLKQARAFGVGVVLATQNPVDLDYKGLANCGTWFIGRLQTERDKARVLDGLEGAAGAIDRAALDQILSGLGSRVFLMNNVHAAAPQVFETRWALSYLRGPLDRNQIRTLMEERRPAPVAAPAKPATAPVAESQRPVLPPDIPQYFLPVAQPAEGVVYQPVLVGLAQVRFVDAKAKVDRLDEYAFLIPVTDEAVPVDWDNATQVHMEASQLEKEPVPGACFAAVPPAAMKKKSYAEWTRDFAAWIATSQSIELFRSPGLGRLSLPGESERNFRARLAQEARESRDAAAGKVRQKYAARMATLEDRIRRAEAMVQKEEAEQQQQTIDTAVDIGGALLGAFLGQRVSRRSIGRLRVKGTMDVDRAVDQLRSLQQQHWDLELAIQQEMNAVAAKMDVTTEQLEHIAIRPKKTNVTVQLLSLAWSPNALQKSE